MSYFRCGFGCLERWLPILLAVMITSNAMTQEKGRYLPGEGNTLEMMVHIIGEVRRPGKYRVRDNTNLVELLSEAGGPTEFSNLNTVTITHAASEWLTNGQNGASHGESGRITRYNVNKYLRAEATSAPPTLKPGDIVLVASNKWRTWRQVAAVIRDIAVITSAYFLYLRATQN